MNKNAIHIDLDSVWIKAAIVGGFWASFEIIAGSFFHNLRIPFSGTLLAANGILLLVAFYQMWPEKGLIWRAGLICALMKSISPSAVILGPMIGIFMEALIIQLFISLFGNNLFSLMIGGALSVASALLHKVFSLLLIYGFKIVVVYNNIVKFAARQIRIESVDLKLVIAILLAGYMLLGFFSVVMGYRIGRRTKRADIPKNGFEPKGLSKRNIFSINPDQKFSIFYLFSLFILIPIGLYLAGVNLVYASIYISIFVLINIFKYRKSLRRLQKPIFWIQLVLLMLLSGIFWKGFNIEWPYIQAGGLLIGVEMILRAIFVVISFSAISVELRNPIIKDFLFNKGFSKLYLSLELAFSALPLMMDALPEAKYFIRHPINSFSLMMKQAGGWLTSFEKQNVAE